MSSALSATSAATPGGVLDQADEKLQQTDEKRQQADEKRKVTDDEQRPELLDFRLIRTLGTGTCGRVMLAVHSRTNEYRAVKILSRRKLVQQRQAAQALQERRILQQISFPFVVQLDCCFKDNSNLYMVMEFVNGGDIFTHLCRRGRFDEQQVKFYSAQILLALQHLHSLRLVYRDLKPENVLLDACGYVKLADFGFAKQLECGSTRTRCGTVEYMAPEIILNQGYNQAVDYWALGVFVYELACGSAPFVAGELQQVCAKVIGAEFECPVHFSPQLQDLVARLLRTDPQRRLGCSHTGAEEVRRHSWYGDVHWQRLLAREAAAPFVPACDGPGDSSNFEDFNEVPLRISSREQFPDEFGDF